jgi:16S rRNA processing protein RimM
MGRLLKPRGLKGGLRLFLFNEIGSSLKAGKKIWIELESGQYSYYLIESLKISGVKSWIKLVECDTCENAEQLSGLKFSIPRSEFTPLSDDDYYLVDLVGSKVLDENQDVFGLVADTMILPPQNLLVVDRHGKEILIPFVDDHISFFDKKKNILILKDVEGLLI